MEHVAASDEQPVPSARTLPATANTAIDTDGVLVTLERITAARGVDPFAARVAALRALVGDDLRGVEQALAAYAREACAEAPEGPTSGVYAAASKLLASHGKRLRPLCVALASRVGSGFTGTARELAIAVEMLHGATLLHDDVVDQGDTRRGEPTARVVYGNAASVFAGDWLLVESLRRITATQLEGVAERAFVMVREMIAAEALQLASRGRVGSGVGDYFRIVDGKTAGLFRFALYAGGRAGGLEPTHCEALAVFGRELGVAFQLIDDALDVAGDPATLGKGLFADLREGKITYPLRRALEQDVALVAALERASRDAEASSITLDPVLAEQILLAVERTDAVTATRSLAQTYVDRALEALGVLPPCEAREALAQVAVASLARTR